MCVIPNLYESGVIFEMVFEIKLNNSLKISSNCLTPFQRIFFIQSAASFVESVHLPKVTNNFKRSRKPRRKPPKYRRSRKSVGVKSRITPLRYKRNPKIKNHNLFHLTPRTKVACFGRFGLK